MAIILGLLGVLCCIIALCLAMMVLRLLPAGTDGIKPLPYAIALIPLLWAPLLACAAISAGIGIAISMRHDAAAMHSIVATTAYCTLLSSCAALALWAAFRMYDRLAKTRVTLQRIHGSAISHFTLCHVMTLNCRFGRANAQSIIQRIRASHIEILALQEVTPQLHTRLIEAGIHDLLPYELNGTQHQSDNGGFNMLFSAFPLQRQIADSLSIDAAAIPSAEVLLSPDHAEQHQSTSTQQPADKQPILRLRVASVHPKSPMRGTQSWSDGIRGIAQFGDPQRFPHTVHSNLHSNLHSDSHHALHTDSCTDSITASDINPDEVCATVVMGDCNSNANHPSFRNLIAHGFIDALTVPADAIMHSITQTHTKTSSSHSLVSQSGLTPTRKPSLMQRLHMGAPLMTFPRWLIWPRMELDHVLVAQHGTELAKSAATTAIDDTTSTTGTVDTTGTTGTAIIACHARAYTIVDSDHLAVVADLVAIHTTRSQ